ncbi:hypothetical protein D3C72_1909730 [compost metagenome]
MGQIAGAVAARHFHAEFVFVEEHVPWEKGCCSGKSDTRPCENTVRRKENRLRQHVFIMAIVIPLVHGSASHSRVYLGLAILCSPAQRGRQVGIGVLRCRFARQLFQRFIDDRDLLHRHVEIGVGAGPITADKAKIPRFLEAVHQRLEA